jgi:complex I assembly factor TIMMDC1
MQAVTAKNSGFKLFSGIVTLMSVYRGKSSIWEYLAAGSATGAVYKLNMGLRGMAAGGIVGLAFGGVAGGVSLGVMKMTGTTMEEVRYWQYKWKTDRDVMINDLMKDQPELKDPMMDKHDEELGEEILSLDFVEGNPEKVATTKEAVKK